MLHLFGQNLTPVILVYFGASREPNDVGCRVTDIVASTATATRDWS